MMTTTIRPNAQGTVNRNTLRKLVQAGRMQARVDYSYDEMNGSHSGDWMSARFSAGYNDFVTGQINLTEDDFDSSCGRAYLTDSGAIRLRVHSNLIYQLRLVS